MKCCNEPLHINIYYVSNLIEYTCHKCPYQKYIVVPKYIPQSQFKQYSDKLYKKTNERI